MSSDRKERLHQPCSSKMDSKHQKQQFLKAVKRVRRSLSPALLSPESEDPQQQEVDAIRATVSGGGADIVVAEPSHAFRLYAMGNFGTFVGQRMNFADWHCFLPDSADITKQEQVREGTEQSEQQPIGTDGGGEGTLKRSKAKESAAEWIGWEKTDHRRRRTAPSFAGRSALFEP